MEAQIVYSYTKVREPTQNKIAQKFKVPAANLTSWRREKEKGKFALIKGDQRRVTSQGKRR